MLAKELYRGLLRILPTKPALYLMYFRGYHKLLNLNNPKYYGEKIQWMKLYGKIEELAPYVDKYAVRTFVGATIGEKYLFDVLGVYDKVEDICFDTLPSSFVAKCTNGSQAVLIVKDKNKLDKEKAIRQMQGWLDDSFYKMKKEFQYKNVKNRILIEKYMEDDSGGLRDYKFYCFNGEPFICCVWNGRFSQKTIDAYDMKGNFLPDFRNGSKKTKTSKNPAPVEKLEEFKNLSRKLAAPFTFVRVDYYLVKNQIYFGELTFSDGAGCEPMFPIDKYDIEFGNKIPLKKIIK